MVAVPPETTPPLAHRGGHGKCVSYMRVAVNGPLAAVKAATVPMARHPLAGSRVPLLVLDARPGDPAPQHRDLMAQHQNLHIFRGRRSGEQHQPADQRDKDQIQESGDMTDESRRRSTAPHEFWHGRTIEA
jgi:hypothetical protein